MSQSHCFEISFPGIDLDKYFVGHPMVQSFHHAHLTCIENEIEIKIFYDSETMFGNKLSHWASTIKWQNFGSFIKIQNDANDNLLRIDLTKASLIKIQTGSSQFEANKQFVRLLIDSVKFYWEPNKEALNTAEFYLNDEGFDLVKDYYALLFADGEQFEISRMNGLSAFYSIENAQFRPEFSFYGRDNKNNREAKIVKEPKIQFNYSSDISEADVFKHADIVCLLSSFFFRTGFYFIHSSIHLKEYTVNLIRVQEGNHRVERFGHLWEFGCYLNYDSFMKTNWQSPALFNFAKLEKVVKMFIQAISVDSNSRFLLLYNIIEVCMSGTTFSAEKFSLVLGGSELEEKYSTALKLILQTVKEEDHQDFTNKWISLKGKLIYKPMKSPLDEFLKGQGLNTGEFPVSLEELKSIRDKITHGSVSGVNSKALDDANILLYRIAGILILNILGIKEWTLKTELPA